MMLITTNSVTTNKPVHLVFTPVKNGQGAVNMDIHENDTNAPLNVGKVVTRLVLDAKSAAELKKYL